MAKKTETRHMSRVKEPKKIVSKENQERFLSVGEKIKLIRKELELTQPVLEDLIQVPRATMHRLEFGIGGSIPAFLAVLQFYADKGYSLQWLLEDNASVMKMKDKVLSFDFDKSKMEKSMKTIQEEVTILEKIVKNM